MSEALKDKKHRFQPRTKIQRSAISKLFSARVMRQFYAKGQSPLFTRLADQTGLLENLPSTTSVRDFFDLAFGILNQIGHRDEYIYRSAITHRILMGTHSFNTTTMLNEFYVGQSVADVVMLNKTSTVYEIKSERDTLKRLQSQLNDYSIVFANVYVIVGPNHVDSVIEHVNSDIGILNLSRRYHISTIRDAKSSHSKIDPVAILNSVRVSEAIGILKYLGHESPEVPNTRMHSALKEIFARLEPVVAHNAMVSVLKNTRSTSAYGELVEILPCSLHASVLSTRPSPTARTHLLEAINSELSETLAWR